MAGKRTEGRGSQVSSVIHALAVLQNHLDNDKKDVVPEGFYTTPQLQEQTGLKQGKLLRLLKHGLALGTVEFREFNTGHRKVPHYKFKETK